MHGQPPPEKPCPNAPKPPRLTLLWPESDDVLDEEWLEESLLKKLDRDDEPEPPLPPEELLLLVHAVLVCTAGSVPGGGGSQLCRGISV
ncbi:hypothetical protein XH79_18295 [Bradyrhizobium sp. CCBAU 45389]|nr:hypothetical protein [Bradyrhizobium sp. CCBAU 45389]